jgi:TRAP-type C4-dicarboxylate transport system permease small subunit
MAFVYVGYIFVTTYEWVVFLGVAYGAGNGVYIAVDYALAVDCLPSQVRDATCLDQDMLHCNGHDL